MKFSRLETAISAITALDILVSSPRAGIPSTYKHGKTVTALFDCILNDTLHEKFNKYIYDTFRLFASTKQKMYISLTRMNVYNEKDDGKLVNLIVNELKEFIPVTDYAMNMNNINILTPQLFNIFTNINYVNIEAHKNHLFSFSELLSLIEGTAIDEVCVNGNWIKEVWESSSEMFVEIYARKNFNIKMEKDQWGHDELIIKRN